MPEETATDRHDSSPLLAAIMNLSKYHREHEKYYASAPREQAVALQRHARSLLALADRWSTTTPMPRTASNPFEGAPDLNAAVAMQLDGILFMEGSGEPAEIVRLKRDLRLTSDDAAATGEWLEAAMESSWVEAELLLDVPELADVLGERHRIIANDWQAALLSGLVAKLLRRAVETSSTGWCSIPRGPPKGSGRSQRLGEVAVQRGRDRGPCRRYPERLGRARRRQRASLARVPWPRPRAGGTTDDAVSEPAAVHTTADPCSSGSMSEPSLLNRYRSSAGGDAIAQLRELAAPLRGCRVLHVSATPFGGGVAEILRSEIPLLRDLGIDADWQLIRGNETFFRVTKTIHNGLQGSAVGLSADDEEQYLAQSERNAKALDEDYDIVVVHDPQPLALLELHGANHSRWIWRCHVDTSEPNPSVWAVPASLRRPLRRRRVHARRLRPTRLPAGAHRDHPAGHRSGEPEEPAVVRPLAARGSSNGSAWTLGRPLIAQISRFDEWKDPLGVVAAYRLVREQVPDLQLALVGSMALDDPEGWRVYRRIQAEVGTDPDIHVFTNLTGVGNVEVNAFQRLADVVVQKSLREGFGLVVSEALWKGTPVVAGRAGGIPLAARRRAERLPRRLCRRVRGPGG